MDVQLGLSYGNVFTWVVFVRKSWMNGWELLALLHSGAWTGYSSTRLLVCDGLHVLTLLTVPTGNSVCKLAFRSIP